MRPFLLLLLLLIASDVKTDPSVISAINDKLSSTVWTENFKIGLKFTDTSYEIQELGVSPSPFIINRKDDLIMSTFTISSNLKEVTIKDVTGDGLPDIRIITIFDKNGKILSTSTQKIVITYIDET